MKRHFFILIALAAILLVTGCRKNPRSIIEIPDEAEYVGEYLDTSDVRRIGQALNSAPTRATVQWENEVTGYQFSMMIFTTKSVPQMNHAMPQIRRDFTVLSIAPARDAEVLDLIGTSSAKNTWSIVAETSAAQVGKATRMNLTATPEPDVSLSSGDNFNGFMVE